MAFEWLNEDSRHFLESGYLEEGVSPEQRIKEIADNAERILGIKGFSDKFYNYMGKGYFSLSSPVWANFGNKRGLPISCYSVDIQDTMGDILRATGEVGMMSKQGGGTGGFFGKLRPRGAKITGNGESSGAVHFVELFESLMDVATQGCYDDKTEVLTERGFMKFEDVINDKTIKVAQVTDSDEIEFVYPTDYMKFKPKDNKLLHFKDSKNIDLLVTKNHNMVFKREYKNRTSEGKYERSVRDDYHIERADKAPMHRDIKYAHGSISPTKGSESGLTALEKLYIAFQADGSYAPDSNEQGFRFHFAKKHKMDRIISILEDLEIEYTFTHYEKEDTYSIYGSAGHKLPKYLNDWVTLEGKSYEWAQDFLKEVSLWDGSIVNKGHRSFEYFSTIESNVDIVQSVASMVGAKSKKTTDLRESEPNKSTIYTLYITQLNRYFGVEKLVPKEVEYDGFVYCVEVPSHKLIVRRNGHTLVCGNSVRRGAFSPYLPVEHPDIEEFLKIGTEGNPVQKLTHAVTVTDKWMKEMIDGDNDKRKIWAEVLQRRVEMGYPYIFFKDTVNNNTVDVYKDKGLEINHSNLCSEVALPTNDEWSFVCCLSSMNLLHYDEWKDTDAVETLTYFLDAVMEEFIVKLEAVRDSEDKEYQQAFYFMEKAYNFAKTNRALGIGALGWHSYLQSNMIPFESIEASRKNIEIFRLIEERAYKASEEMAELYGEPELLEGYGRRNSTLLAPAPTTSSAFILGQVSQSIEPLFSNSYVKDLAKTKVTVRNPYLKEVLAKYNKDDRETWNSIRDYDGSVQHLDFLTDHEKDVFKTFSEIDQYAILDQAAMRQQFIDQSQSLNLMINPSTPAKEINNLYIFAWENGIKTLYYQHGTNAAQQFNKDLNCMMCEA